MLASLYGRCMRLIVMSVIRAKEEGAIALDIEDFRSVFDIKLKNYNPLNPFEFTGWSDGAKTFEKSGETNPADVLFDDRQPETTAKKKGRKTAVKGGK